MHGYDNRSIGLTASGAEVIMLSTGGGSPCASPIAPTMKVTGNERTYRKLREHMDVDVSSILRGEETIDDAGKRVLEEVLRVASGKITKVESLGYASTAIETIGPLI